MPLLDATMTAPTSLAPAADLGLLDTATVLDVVKGGAKNDLNVRDMIVDITIDRTMSGASTITFELHDPERKLLRSPALATAVQVLFDGYGYRLASKKKSGASLTLIFEDSVIAYLRSKKLLVTASRNDVTRVQFCTRLCRMVKSKEISVYAPESARKIRTAKLNRSDEARLAGRESGINPNETLTVKGVKATKQQIKNMEAMLDAASDVTDVRRILIICAMTTIGEDQAHNSKMAVSIKTMPDGTKITVPTNAGSVGMFQQRASQGWPASGDIKKDTVAFVKGTSKGNVGAVKVLEDNPDMTNWEVAAEVQRPRIDLRQSTYDPWETEATAWVDAYSPGERGGDRTFAGRYTFSTRNDSNKLEDFWTTIKRLMDEVQWAAFAQQNKLWLVREAYLTTRRPVMLIDPDMVGIEDIDFDWNINKDDASASIVCDASRWKAPPGTCVILQGLGFDKERWLVDSIGRSAFDPRTTIDLRTAQHSLPEPAAQLITVSPSARGRKIEGSDVNGLPEAIAAAYREAQKIDAKRYPYSWGGGHEHAGTPSRHAETSRGGRIVLGYDCSGSTAAVLAAAEAYVKGSKGFGLPKKGDSVPGSKDFGSYGVYGEGKYLTWWYNVDHVFMEFKRPSQKADDGTDKVEHFGTGRWGKDWGGPGFNSELHGHAGFSPAHIPGM